MARPITKKRSEWALDILHIRADQKKRFDATFKKLKSTGAVVYKSDLFELMLIRFKIDYSKEQKS
jgi:hypothetical protein